MFGVIAANLQVLNILKSLPVSKKSVVSSTKILFTNIILRTLSGQVIISQYTDVTESENTYFTSFRRGRKIPNITCGFPHVTHWCPGQ